MAVNQTTDLVLEGVGEALLVSPDGSVSPLGKLQDMKISISTSIEKVYGGDSLFEFYQFIKDKTCEFEFTNATFNLAMVQLSQGSTASIGECYATETVTVATQAAALSKTSGVSTAATDITVINATTGAPLTIVSADPASATEVKVTSAGALTFHADVTDGTKFTVSYVYTSSDTVGTDILTTSVPGFVELRHTSKTIEMPDGNKYRVHTRVYKARCDGSLEVSYARGTASAPKLKFSSLDPQRVDKKFCSFTIEKMA